MLGMSTPPAPVSVAPADVARFVAAMSRTLSGRTMANRVFRQVSGESHGSLLTDSELATYLLGQSWTFADVCRRES